MALVELAIFHDPTTAEIARSRLANEGIAAVLFDSGLASLGLGAMTPVRLMVAEQDEEAARRLLSAIDRGEAG
ncbi:MAG: DUF2007 domain-containing protein [Pseudomonadota bacterium]|nr:DUF2007 domain-containing protein [Pseudomonadota bacterium]